LPFEPLGVFKEVEGISIIITQAQAREISLPQEPIWACVTLRIHSSLKAVGFLSAIVKKLAGAGISVNPVSAYYHDHLFVPWESREVVMELLKELGPSP
jgi:hypothetical protein